MNVNTIIVSAAEAERKLDQYRSIQVKLRTREDDQLAKLYAAIRRGARVLDLGAAFKQTGLNERGEPKLAIARADQGEVSFSPNTGPGRWGLTTVKGGGVFFRSPFDYRATRQRVTLPAGTFPEELKSRSLKSAVPHVPPDVRPQRAGLHNFHILFEVQHWEEYPVDPYLLRHVGGRLYIVEAEWELTAVEASLLGSLRGDN